MVETDLMSGFIADTLNKNRVSVEAGVNSGFGGRPVVVTTTTESVEQIRPNQTDSNSRVSSGVVGTTPYPFQISATPALLKSAPGLLGAVSILSQEKINPADGAHYLLAKVVINSTTGVITSSTVEWETTEPADTTTDYHRTIAVVTLTDGVVSGPPNTAQFTFGPISVVVGGGSSTVFAARLL